MDISYNRSWKLLIEKGMKKVNLVENQNIGINRSTLTKISKGETISMDILERICMELDCDIGNLIHYKKDISKR